MMLADGNFKLYNFVEAQIAKESRIESNIGEMVSQLQIEGLMKEAAKIKTKSIG